MLNQWSQNPLVRHFLLISFLWNSFSFKGGKRWATPTNEIPTCELSTQDHQAEVPGDKVGGVCTAAGGVEGNEVGGGCCWLHHLPTQQLTARNTKCERFLCICEYPSNLFGLCHLQHSPFSAETFQEKGRGE